MHQAEIIVLLFTVVAASVLVARKMALPYPVVLVLVGLVMSFVPRLPEVKLDPNIVFYFFLPPLLYPAALFTSWRDFRRNLRPIVTLAIGLVLFTMVVVASVAHALIPSLPWAAAFALGAIVSPPDAVAATSIIRRLAVPHRTVSILEGESLLNDATALVALQFAVVAMMTGKFSLGQASLRFVWAAAGGIGLGLLVGVAPATSRRSTGANHYFITNAVSRVFACRALARIGRFGRGRRRNLSWLAFSVDGDAALSIAGVRLLGNRGVPSERFCFHGDRSSIAGNPAIAWGGVSSFAYSECASRLRCGGAGTDRVGFSGRISAFSAAQERASARAAPEVAGCGGHGLVGNAWGRLLGGRICAALCFTERQPVPRKELHFVSDLCRDFGDSVVPRLDATNCDSKPLH